VEKCRSLDLSARIPLMNLDALFEDLEAQAYFQSKGMKSAERSTCRLAVLRSRTEFADLILSSPLLGLDFVAGFSSQNGQPTWQIVPHQSLLSLQPADDSASFSEAHLSFSELIEFRLLGIPVAIHLAANGVQKLNISRVIGNFIEGYSDQGITIISMSAIERVVVENLSKLEKFLAT